MSKFLAFILVPLFIGPMAHAAQMPLQPLKAPGEFLIRQILPRVPWEAFLIYGNSEPVISNQEIWIMNDLDYLFKFPPPIHFAESNDPMFRLSPSEPPRAAVTNPSRKSVILFNRGIVDNPQLFDLSRAYQLLFHELGHKVDPDIKRHFPNYQNSIDVLATKVASILTSNDWSESFELEGQAATLIIHSSYRERRTSPYDHPNDRYDQAIWPLILLDLNNQIYNLADFAYAAFDQVNQDKNNNLIYTALVIREVQIEPAPAGVLLRLSITYQMNKKDSISRFQNRYSDEIIFLISSKNGQLHLSSPPDDSVPNYPEDSSIQVLAQVKGSLAEGQIDLDLELKTNSVRYWYLQETTAIFLIDGKKISIPVTTTGDANLKVRLKVPNGARDISFLGLNMHYMTKVQNPNSLRGVLPWDHYFVPLQKELRWQK